MATNQSTAPIPTPVPTPMFSPAGGYGSTYTDPGTGITSIFQNNGWSPISSGANQLPQTYAPTPASSGSVLGLDTGGGGGGGFNISNYPGYSGWDPNAAYQDWLTTGGGGKRRVWRWRST